MRGKVRPVKHALSVVVISTGRACLQLCSCLAAACSLAWEKECCEGVAQSRGW